jgi:hypothetical protein
MSWWISQLPLQGQPSSDDRLLGRSIELAAGGPDPEQTDNVMLIRHRVSRIYYLRRFFDYPISLKWATLRNLGLGRTTRAGFSYLWSTIRKRPEASLEDFKADHHRCWDAEMAKMGNVFDDHTMIVVEHFTLMEKID